MLKPITIMAAGILVAGGAGLAVTAHGGTHSASTLQNIELSANAQASGSNSPAHWGHRDGFGPRGQWMKDAAKALNLSTSTLKADLKAGQSLATIAQDHGSSASALESTLLSDAKAKIQAAVSAGKMTQTQATQMESHLSTMIDQMVTRTGMMPKGGAWNHRGGFGMMGNVMSTIAKDLNISTSTLKADLKAGQSLATIAQDHGSSASALESTLLSDAQAKIQSAVSAGKLTQTQATQMESHLSTLIDQMVTHSGPMGHMHYHGSWSHAPSSPAAS
ncbi:MAG: hypothetical protein C7B44_14285 [Sulfobacillus thermosulfidooxidans]|nr:MAG: hypothetical protein C7B44_14285 [Sulfobacillus thermosulfidooxidans]